MSAVQFVGNYDLIKTIGQGQFGKVKLARHALTGEIVAVKIIHKSQLDEKSLRLVAREVNVMKRLDHPNIINLYEVLETDKMLFLVMEYASGGEVLEYIVTHGRLRESEARRVFQQVIEAVMHCHSNFVVHRDLKAENLLFDSDRTVKLVDFGLSNVFTPGNLLSTFCGSPTYAAPELLRKTPYKGPEIDVWSSGVLLYVLTCGALPFDGEDFRSLFSKILAAKFVIPPFVSPDLEDLICRMLVVDPKERITMAEVRQHIWVTNGEQPITPASPSLPKKEITLENIDHDVLAHLETLGFDREDCVKSVIEKKYDVRASTYDLLVRKREKDRKRREEAATRKKEMLARRQQQQQAQQKQQQRGHRRGASCTPAMVASMTAGGTGEGAGGQEKRTAPLNKFEFTPPAVRRGADDSRVDSSKGGKDEGRREPERRTDGAVKVIPTNVDTSPVVFNRKPQEEEKEQKKAFVPTHRRIRTCGGDKPIVQPTPIHPPPSKPPVPKTTSSSSVTSAPAHSVSSSSKTSASATNASSSSSTITVTPSTTNRSSQSSLPPSSSAKTNKSNSIIVVSSPGGAPSPGGRTPPSSPSLASSPSPSYSPNTPPSPSLISGPPPSAASSPFSSSFSSSPSAPTSSPSGTHHRKKRSLSKTGAPPPGSSQQSTTLQPVIATRYTEEERKAQKREKKKEKEGRTMEGTHRRKKSTATGDGLHPRRPASSMSSSSPYSSPSTAKTSPTSAGSSGASSVGSVENNSFSSSGSSANSSSSSSTSTGAPPSSTNFNTTLPPPRTTKRKLEEDKNAVKKDIPAAAAGAAAKPKEPKKGGHRRTRSVVPNLPAVLGGNNAKPKEKKLEVEGDQAEPRVVRGAISNSNMSMKQPQEILLEIHRVLGELGATGVHASVQGSPFLVVCLLGDVNIELEVCEVEGISKTYFVRMKRIRGEPMHFKKTCEKLTERLVL